MNRQEPLARLRMKAILAGAAQVCLSVAWAAIAAPRSVVPWLVGATSVAVYFVWVLWRHAPGNQSKATAALSPRFGWGTAVTLLRVGCLALLSGYLLSPPAPSQLWPVAGLYTAIGAGDWLDGFLARRTGHETRLGELLDLRVDVMGMLIASVVAISVGRLPVWYLLLSCAYFIFHTALVLRRRAGRPCYQERLCRSAHARTFAGYHMALVAAAFVPILDTGTVHVVATILMVPSLVAFGRDWCVATGQLVPNTESYRRLVERLIVSTRRVWPVLLRPILVGAMIWLKPASTIFGSVWLVFAVAIGIGFLPRVTVLLPLVAVALAPVETAMELILVVTAANILVLGSGDHSLYTPEEHWFFGRHGRTAAADARAAMENR